MPRLALALALAVTVAGAASAAAQPDSLHQAQALFDEAQQAILTGDYDGAAAKFKEAYAQRALPDLLYNTGTAYYLKGKKESDAASYGLAVKYYKDYLDDAPTAADKPEVEKAIAIIEKEIERLGAGATGAPSEDVAKLDARTRSLVVIETEPQGANIYLDDKSGGVFAQTPWSGSLDGPHKVIIEKRGHKSKESSIAPDPNRLVVLQVVLSEEDYLGWLEIKSNVPGAAIYADDRSVGAIGKTPYSGNFPPGKHTFWIEADGYQPIEREVEIVAGKTHALDLNLSGSPVGYLNVRGSGLARAHVLVDGREVCERAPCRVPLNEGPRAVLIRRPGHKSYRTKIDVQARTEVTIRPNLIKKPGRTDAVVAYIFAAVFAGGGTGAYVYARGLEPTDSLYDDRKYVRYGAYAGWGLAGIIGLSAVYYTFRDKGPPSTGQIDVRAVALTPAVGPDYAGLGVAARF